MPVTTNITWPASLPCPQLRGHVVEPYIGYRQLIVLEGPSRYRQTSFRNSFRMAASWVLHDVEMADFTQFYRADLSEGALWFNMDADYGAGYASRIVHFESGYQSEVLTDQHWRVRATLEVLA